MPDQNFVATPAAEETTPSMAQKWKAASNRWAKDAKLAFLSNPATRRDLRVQFRGNKSAPLFALIVAGLAGVSLFMYWTVSQRGPISPSEVQAMLNNFCAIILSVIAGVITLITPVLAASAILVEKQRRSLELVFSSPINPKTYLFGKLVASYRYVWVLMALSLPFTAMSVIMGGGTWWNILECYFLLSIQGLLFTTIGLYFSALVDKTVQAMLYTYGTVAAYLFTVIMAVNSFVQLAEVQPMRGGERPFGLALIPVFVGYASGTITRIFGVGVPNVLIATVLIGTAVNYILTCASGLVSPLRERERKSLRIKSLAIFAAAATALSYVDLSLLGASQSARQVTMLVLTLPLLPFVAFLSCYGSDGERRTNYKGLFAWRDWSGKSVAGALPYIYSVILAVAGGTVLGSLLSHRGIDQQFFPNLIYGFGFWTFVWSTARFSSSLGHGVKPARTLQFLSFAATIAIPLPLLIVYTMHYHGDAVWPPLWDLYPLSPFLLPGQALLHIIHGLLMLVGGGALAGWSEKNYRKNAEKKKLERMAQETPLSATALYGRSSSLLENGSVAEISDDEPHRFVQGA